MTEKVYVK
uniref:Uncharacterized protein n=1 Tax=Meloidogyne hapla TaxID=6305 RepID=A0A1I8BG78_MELHA